MKKMIFKIFILLFSSSLVWAGDFLEVPVIPGAQTISEDGGRLQFKTGRSHDEVLAFYQNPDNMSQNDVKVRKRSDSTYIEDNSNRPWHSIVVLKGNDVETTVIISKDSWTWIFGTLILRYIGVFVVLLVLYLGMKLSGAIISSSVEKAAAK
jgi:hypothetical protein